MIKSSLKNLIHFCIFLFLLSASVACTILLYFFLSGIWLSFLVLPLLGIGWIIKTCYKEYVNNKHTGSINIKNLDITQNVEENTLESNFLMKQLEELEYFKVLQEDAKQEIRAKAKAIFARPDVIEVYKIYILDFKSFFEKLRPSYFAFFDFNKGKCLYILDYLESLLQFIQFEKANTLLQQQHALKHETERAKIAINTAKACVELKRHSFNFLQELPDLLNTWKLETIITLSYEIVDFYDAVKLPLYRQSLSQLLNFVYCLEEKIRKEVHEREEREIFAIKLTQFVFYIHLSHLYPIFIASFKALFDFKYMEDKIFISYEGEYCPIEEGLKWLSKGAKNGYYQRAMEKNISNFVYFERIILGTGLDLKQKRFLVQYFQHINNATVWNQFFYLIVLSKYIDFNLKITKTFKAIKSVSEFPTFSAKKFFNRCKRYFESEKNRRHFKSKSKGGKLLSLFIKSLYEEFLYETDYYLKNQLDWDIDVILPKDLIAQGKSLSAEICQIKFTNCLYQNEPLKANELSYPITDDKIKKLIECTGSKNTLNQQDLEHFIFISFLEKVFSQSHIDFEQSEMDRSYQSIRANYKGIRNMLSVPCTLAVFRKQIQILKENLNILDLFHIIAYFFNRKIIPRFFLKTLFIAVEACEKIKKDQGNKKDNINPIRLFNLRNCRKIRFPVGWERLVSKYGEKSKILKFLPQITRNQMEKAHKKTQSRSLENNFEELECFQALQEDIKQEIRIKAKKIFSKQDIIVRCEIYLLGFKIFFENIDSNFVFHNLSNKNKCLYIFSCLELLIKLHQLRNENVLLDAALENSKESIKIPIKIVLFHKELEYYGFDLLKELPHLLNICKLKGIIDLYRYLSFFYRKINCFPQEKSNKKVLGSFLNFSYHIDKVIENEKGLYESGHSDNFRCERGILFILLLDLYPLPAVYFKTMLSFNNLEKITLANIITHLLKKLYFNRESYYLAYNRYKRYEFQKNMWDLILFERIFLEAYPDKLDLQSKREFLVCLKNIDHEDISFARQIFNIFILRKHVMLNAKIIQIPKGNLGIGSNQIPNFFSKKFFNRFQRYFTSEKSRRNIDNKANKEQLLQLFVKNLYKVFYWDKMFNEKGDLNFNINIILPKNWIKQGNNLSVEICKLGFKNYGYKLKEYQSEYAIFNSEIQALIQSSVNTGSYTDSFNQEDIENIMLALFLDKIILDLKNICREDNNFKQLEPEICNCYEEICANYKKMISKDVLGTKCTLRRFREKVKLLKESLNIINLFKVTLCWGMLNQSKEFFLRALFVEVQSCEELKKIKGGKSNFSISKIGVLNTRNKKESILHPVKYGKKTKIPCVFFPLITQNQMRAIHTKTQKLQ